MVDFTLPTPGVTSDWGDDLNTALDQIKTDLNDRLSDTQLSATFGEDANAALVDDTDSALSIAIQNLIGNYEPETLTLLDRMSVRPDSDRRTAINNLVNTLKTAGIWVKLDGLYVLAAHHEQAARLNWVRAAADLTAINSPAFEVDTGFTGDGSTAYLSNGESIATSVNYTDAEAFMAVWAMTSVASTGQFDISAQGPTYINTYTGSEVAVRANHGAGQGSVIGETVGTGLGLAAFSRDATDVTVYKDGADAGSTAMGYLSPLPSNPLFVLRGNGGTQYSTRQLGLAAYGGRLTSTEVAQFYAAALTYMQAVGAVA